MAQIIHQAIGIDETLQDPRRCRCGGVIVSPRSKRCAACGAAAARMNFAGLAPRRSCSSTSDVLRMALSSPTSKKGAAVLAMVETVGNGSSDLLLRHAGGVPWDALTLSEQEAIIGTMAALRPALQAAGILPHDLPPGELDLSLEGDGDRAL